MSLIYAGVQLGVAMLVVFFLGGLGIAGAILVIAKAIRKVFEI